MMRRVLKSVPFTLLFVFLPLDAAVAHGVEESYNIPVPLWLYLYGSAAAVLLSFVPISILSGGEYGVPYRYPRFDLLGIRALRAVLTARALLFGLRLLSVGLFVLVILGGLLGGQGSLNFAPTFVWVTWWVGLGFFTALVGNIWPLVNPWKILFEWADGLARRLGSENGLEPAGSDPASSSSLGLWPAVVLYLIFVWFENVFPYSYEPFAIALFTIVYSVVTWCGMIVFGKEVWLRQGEAFSVFFSLVGRFAPTEVRVREGCEDDGCVNCYECFAQASPGEREINLRPPAVGLGRPETLPAGGVTFVVLVLAGVTYDGLLETSLWADIVRFTPMTRTLGLVALTALFLAVYLSFVWFSRLFGGGAASFGRFAAAYAFSLVPIAIAYQAAHYYTLLLVQGPFLIPIISDPFGRGWNLFGTASYPISVDTVGVAFLWYSQIALIVGGHVVAVYLAHSISRRLGDGDKRRGTMLAAQLPMLALMLLYTVSTLWILSQPLVVE